MKTKYLRKESPLVAILVRSLLKLEAPGILAYLGPSRTIDYMKSQSLRDHCLYSFLIAFTRFSAVLTPSQLFHPWGKHWGENVLFCLRLSNLLTFSFFPSMCVRYLSLISPTKSYCSLMHL